MLYVKLPPCVQRHIRPFREYPHLFAMAMDVESYPGDQALPGTEVWACREPLLKVLAMPANLTLIKDLGQDRFKSRNVAEKKLDKFYCREHGHGSHSTDHCKKLLKENGDTSKRRSAPPQEAPITPKPLHQRLGPHRQMIMSYEEAKKKRQCAYCALPWTKDHQQVCSSKPKRDYPSIKMIRISDPDPEMFSQETINEDQIVFMVSSGSSGCPQAPVLINGVKVIAGLDTHASLSVISPKLRDHLNVAMVPKTGYIYLADGSTVARQMSTSAISVQCGDKTVNHTFEVMDLGGGANCFIGIDLMPKLGIALTGMPVISPRRLKQPLRK